MSGTISSQFAEENIMNKRMNTLTVLVAFIAGIIGGRVGSASAHGGDISLIHACVKDKAGDVKIVGANSNCPTGYGPLHWNIMGP